MKKMTVLLILLASHELGVAQTSPSLGEKLGNAIEKAAKATGAIKDDGPPRKIARQGGPMLVLKDGKIYFNEKNLALGESMQSWKKIIGAGSVCGEKQWPQWCKWDALGIVIGTSMKKNDRVEYLTVYLNNKPSENELNFPELAKHGKPVAHPWVVARTFPGYFEFDGYGIDRKTKFWEIRSSVNRVRQLRCGLRDCSNPIGALNETVGIYMKLAGRSEYDALQEINLSLGEN